MSTSKIPVVIVGAGPVGMTIACELINHQIPVVLVDRKDEISKLGSRAICYSRKTLDVLDKYGLAQKIVNQGVSWNKMINRFQDKIISEFEFSSGEHHKFPPYINLPQFDLERILFEYLSSHPLVDIRFKSHVTNIVPLKDEVTIQIQSQDKLYSITSKYVIASDGSHSSIRKYLKFPLIGQSFDEYYLIVDVKIDGNLPAERWFWFDPPFNPGRCALLLRQTDDLYRIDFQLGSSINREVEHDHTKIENRIKSMIGDIGFEIKWSSIYQFRCQRLAQFVFDNIFFAGDSAHQVSPFGARGANSGIQDAENLGWKLSLLIKGISHKEIIHTYNEERLHASNENLTQSIRSTQFISPKSKISRTFRDSVLMLSRRYPFAKEFINSGRLSVPSAYPFSQLNTLDQSQFKSELSVGDAIVDVPLLRNKNHVWLTDLMGLGFAVIHFVDSDEIKQEIHESDGVHVKTICISQSMCFLHDQCVFTDYKGLAKMKYDSLPGTVYLIRPDRHIAARWRSPNTNEIKLALKRAMCGLGEV